MAAQIEGKELTDEDIGRRVSYHDPYKPTEIGVLSSFRDDGAIWVRFKGPTGERCDPESLRWESP